jgi:hypothetical protein
LAVEATRGSLRALVGPHFGAEQLHAAGPRERQDRHHEDQHAHAADELRQRPPQQDALGHALQHGDDRGTRRRHAGHGFENRGDRRRDDAGQHERRRARQARAQPPERHHAQPVAARQFLVVARQYPQGHGPSSLPAPE